MDNLLKEFMLILVTVATWIKTGGSIKEDVCNWKLFEASCADNEVIQMKQAHYGLMSGGSCIKKNLDSVTRCQVDVLSYLDSVCSGRQTCQLQLPDQNLVTGHQWLCLQNLQSYLQLEYNCVTVYTSPTPCTKNPLPVVGSKGFLSNVITGKTRHGSQDCPWEVRGDTGQKIRLTLRDYGVWRLEEVDPGNRETEILPPKSTGICQIYARITEGGSERTITICGGEKRENVVYVSGTEGVQIALTDPTRSQNPAFFLLQYEVIGCPTFVPPEGTVIEKQGEEILVRCPQTGNEWRMSCDGMGWTTGGETKNCNVSAGPSMSFGNLVHDAQAIPQWILIVVIIVAAAIIAVPILVIGIVSFRRKHDTMNTPRPNPQMEAEKYLPPSHYNAKELDHMLVSESRPPKYHTGREYTSTAHRQMAVRPEAVTPEGRFPPLPLPPSPSFPDDCNHTIDGTLSHDSYKRDVKRTMFKPPMTEHKYESPTFVRRMRTGSDTTDPVCLELDIAHAHVDSEPPREHTECDTKIQ